MLDPGEVTEHPNQSIFARPLEEHPLDRMLRELGPRSSADNRLEVVWQAYEAEANQPLARPPSDAQRADVLRWMRGSDQAGDGPGLLNRRPLLTPLLHGTVAEKAWNITQLGCRIHHPDDVQAGPVVSFPVGIEPWSAQSTREKVALRSAVTAALTAKHTQLLPFGDLPLCLTITALVARASPKKDIDNLVKGLLDAMQGYLYQDDRQIECLTVRRMEYAGASGHYVVHALPTLPVTGDVIFDAPTPPALLSGLVPSPD